MGEEKYFDEEFSSLAEKLLARYHVPGLSIAVVDNGKTYSKGYGLARFPSTPATPDTLYYGGSTTKAMIAAALGVAIHSPDKIKLERKSKDPLSWSTPLQSILGDDFTLQDKYVSENATVEDSLSHRIGLSGHEMIYGSYLGDRPRELTKRLRFLGPLDKPFRTTMQYNNFMYAVAGDVLETLTGSTCSEALQDLLWKPLGMNRTFWDLKEVANASHINRDKDMTRGYFWVEGSKAEEGRSVDGFHVPDNYIDFAVIAPAGAVISSVLDYTKWIQALLDAASSSNKDPSSTTNPITSKLFTELTTTRITSTLPVPQSSQLASTSWGLGWNIIPALCGPLHPMIAHSGGLSGYGTMLYILPNDSFGVITMGNTSLTANLVGGLLSQELIARKLGLKSPGREKELQDLNLIMKSQLIGMEHCIEAHPGDDTSEDTKTMMKNTAVPAGSKMAPEEFIHKKDQDLSELQQLEGIYANGAYGSFRISIVPAASDSKDGREKAANTGILYRFPRDKALNETKDTIRASCYSLKVDMVGKRSWNSRYLLHPRVPEPTKDNADRNANVTWFDQECISGHGTKHDDEYVAGFASGIDGEDGDGTGKCRGGTYWESAVWTRLGAAFVKDDGTGKMKMGMTLANSMYVVDGTREAGWESSKVWFEREG